MAPLIPTTGGSVTAFSGQRFGSRCALFEQVGLDHGRIVEPSLAAYRVPRFGDGPLVPDQPTPVRPERPGPSSLMPPWGNGAFWVSGRSNGGRLIR